MQKWYVLTESDRVRARIWAVVSDCKMVLLTAVQCNGSWREASLEGFRDGALKYQTRDELVDHEGMGNMAHVSNIKLLIELICIGAPM